LNDDLKRQLRAELRHKDEHRQREEQAHRQKEERRRNKEQLNEDQRLGDRWLPGSRKRSQSSPSNSPTSAAQAVVKRISTPPMATGDPGSSKASHDLPARAPQAEPSQEVRPEMLPKLQEELRRMPAAKGGRKRDGSRAKGKTASRDPGREVALPAALRGL